MAYVARQEVTSDQKQVLIDRAIKNKTNQSIELRAILQEAVDKDKRKKRRKAI
jgi:hypothetical protein|tara:strand:- start:11507 stop:11665 length:159 start_codon:yes stop_codon:yes gene_type:complete